MTKSIGIIGAGSAGLVTAHVLLRDGFDVTVLTRDRSPGGKLGPLDPDIGLVKVLF
jgi:dimethylaniline monooxygenase (N-oxide forming)